VSESDHRSLLTAVLSGDVVVARELTLRALAQGIAPERILQDDLVPAMDEAGVRFEAREFFLPELLSAASAMKGALALLTPLLSTRHVPPVGTVVIGTVAGDLHDIGKNIVAAMLEGGGFAVHDLGYDVKPEDFARAAGEHDADIVAVSALLTTSVPGMWNVAAALGREGLSNRVALLVGGAPLTDELARQMGAQGYAPTAAEGVRVARRLLAGRFGERVQVSTNGNGVQAPLERARQVVDLSSMHRTRRRRDSVTPRALVKQALEFESPERLPRQLWLLPWAEQRYPQTVARLVRDFPADIVPIPLFCSEPVPGQGNAHSVGIFVDSWGCKFHNLQDGIIGEVKQPQVKDWSDTAHVQFPRERLTIDTPHITAFCRKTERYVLAGTCPRPFERLQFLRGTENLLLDLARPPSTLHDFLARLHEFYVEELSLWAQTDVDGLAFMDDWGSQQSLLISPEQWREMFKPLYEEYVEIAHAHGKHAFMHSDGYIGDIIPDLIEIGVDALNSQVFCMGVEELGRRFGGELTFWGELDRQHLLPHAGVPEIAEAAQRLTAAFHRDGGFIAQCEFGPGARPENVYAFFAACEAW
jgi:uroporphyrinogen decarboxylase